MIKGVVIGKIILYFKLSKEKKHYEYWSGNKLQNWIYIVITLSISSINYIYSIHIYREREREN